MYNVKLAGLDPAKFYYVRVRAKVFGYETSEWSIPFKFETPKDTMPPGRPEQVSFISEGDSFIAKWDAPPLNEDGTPCGDISHYKLVFRDMNRDVVAVERSVDTTFVMDFNRNVQMFGIAAGKIEMVISAVDLAGNEGRAVTAIAQNPPPAKVKNVSAHPSMESVRLSWSENEDNDLQHYQIHVSTEDNFPLTEVTLRALAAPGTNTFIYDTASLTRQYFKIVAVDKFNQISPESDVVSAQPKLSTDIDRDPPGPVRNFTVTQSLSPDNATAVAMVGFDPGTEEDLDGYEIQYRRTNELVLPWSFRIIPSDETSAEIGPLPLGTNYDFKIRSSDISGNKSAWSSVVVALGVKKTSLPPSPTSMTIRGGLTNLMVTWVESADETMTNWAGTYEVEVDETIGFTNSLTIKTTSTLASFINLEPNTNYYVRIRSIDPYGNVGEWSVPVTGNTGSVTVESSSIFWSDEEPQGGTEDDLWIKTPENVQYRYNGIDWEKAQDVELTGKNRNIYSEQDATGVDLNGIPFNNGDTWFKKDEQNAIVKMWEFYNDQWIVKEISNLAPDSVTATELAADSVTADKILAREITGEHLAINTGIVNNLKIKSSIEIDDAEGHIKSANYVHDGNAGFYMDQQQLIINQGRIKAGALEIQDSQNLLTAAYAGLSYRSEFYTDAIIPTDGGVFYHWPGAGRLYGGAIAHEGENTTLVFSAVSVLDLTHVNKGEKYIVSGYIRRHFQTVGSVSASLGAFVIDASTDEHVEHWGDTVTVDKSTYEWTRVQLVFEADVDGLVAIALKNNGSTNPDDIPVWSSFQIERVVAGVEEASPWSPPGNTAISGDSIITGSITSNQNIPTANGAIPRWSINTEGNARFADAVIDGKLIVGGRESETDNENTYIQSDNYDPGNAGWAIKGDGDVEFNNGTFRGKLSLERSGINPLPLRMTASVSNINSYTTKDVYEPVTTANIRGTTYGYDRSDANETGVFLPTVPNMDNRGNFFIGPTTEKALNIQVHDGPSEEDVYLSEPPTNITVSRLNIGEQTDSSRRPAQREDHGLRYQTQRSDSRDYSYGGKSTGDMRNETLVSYESVTRERSPLIPERIASNLEHPESVNILRSSIEYETPGQKNLIPPGIALGTEPMPENPVGQIVSVRRFTPGPQSGQYVFAYDLLGHYGGAPIQTAKIATVYIPDAGPYILSFYARISQGYFDIPTENMYVGAMISGVWGTANDPVEPSEVVPSSMTIPRESAVRLDPGTTGLGPLKRVSMYFPHIATGTRDVSIVVHNEINHMSNPFILGVQLERAAYREDASLPYEMRESYEPTPWTPVGAKVNNDARFELKTTPFVHPEENRKSNGLHNDSYHYDENDPPKEYSTEAVISLSSVYEGEGSVGDYSSEADYKFTLGGLTLPGSLAPFLPTGITLRYDYSQLPSLPVVGNGQDFLINNRSDHPVQISDSNRLVQHFNRSIGATSNMNYPGWITSGQNGRMRASGSALITMNPNLAPANDGYALMYMTRTLDNADQTATVVMREYTEAFGTYVQSPIGGPVINLDPITGARVSVSYDPITKVWSMWKFTSYSSRTTLATGTLSIPARGPFTLTLSRLGNTVTFKANGSEVRSVTESTIKTGMHVGINPRRGAITEFYAADSAESGTPIGKIEVGINVNNGKGIVVNRNGNITVPAPGYYAVTALVDSPSGLGNHVDDRFRIGVYTGQRFGNVTISTEISRPGGETRYLQGSGVVFLSEDARFSIITADAGTSQIRSATLQVVRLM